jgi:type IV pilus assembly protein PilV
MKKFQPVQTDRGFTLIEAMIAGGVLAGVLMGLSGVQAVTLTKNVDSKEVTVSTNLGTEMIERIQSNRQKVLDYHNIDTTAGTPCPQSAATQRQALGDCQQWRAVLANSNLNTARGTVTVTRIDPDPVTGAASMNRLSVVVTLTWKAVANTNLSGQTMTTTYRAVIAPE